MTMALLNQVREQIENRFLYGNSELLERLTIAYLAQGHVLIEGPPGTAKTLTAKLMAHVMAKSFKRIQFTTDMLPSDILGAHIYSPAKQDFNFIPGPIFADFIVADEINRTPPRTQSALLEAMEERQVTVEGTRMELSSDFFVLATQNPSDFEGTFPLPEVQLDRFLFKLVVNHASAEVEVEILKGIMAGTLPPVFGDLKPLKIDRAVINKEIQAVQVSEAILRYITSLIHATRKHGMLSHGSSVRGAIALGRCARIQALVQGRDFVTPDDVKLMTQPTLRHRVRLTPEAQLSSVNVDGILTEILEKVAFPK